MAAHLSDSLSELRQYQLSNVHPTGTTIGSGSYGNVVEVAIPGALCAAKEVHDILLDSGRIPPDSIQKVAQEFVRECKLMSTLRHPHIVQFLGVCFLPGSRMPALVMEKLATSLHDILDPDPPPPTKPFVPLSLKRSILHDVARGLLFLHSHSPPIIHRDLSARNVLLNEGMAAKIADLGMARMIPALRASTMTKAPGASIYMPPEALEDKSKYDVSIDIFSFGVLAIFTLSQIFPKPLAAAFMDENGRMVGRTELERREIYMKEIRQNLGSGHTFIEMIESCLKNRIKERPTIQKVIQWLEQESANIEKDEGIFNKLSLLQALKVKKEELVASNEQVELRRHQNEIQKEQLQYRLAQVMSLEDKIQQLEAEVESLKEKLRVSLFNFLLMY